MIHQGAEERDRRGDFFGACALRYSSPHRPYSWHGLKYSRFFAQDRMGLAIAAAFLAAAVRLRRYREPI